MVFKVLLLACLALVLFESSFAAPNPSRREQDLTKSFVEFLQQDKQIASALERANLGDGQLFDRQKRQALDEGEMMTSEQGMDDPKGKPGLFDRAAKFVMEVLQRFLKWVNEDNH